MALDITIFETIVPSRFITFTIPNPSRPADLLRVAVLDSPTEPPPDHIPIVGVLFVPQNRESDWTFSTKAGQLQLLLPTHELSRLILIGKDPPVNFNDSVVSYFEKGKETRYLENIGNVLDDMLCALCPLGCVKDGVSGIHILDFDDNTICRVVLGRFIGVLAGEMLVEDVEIEINSELGGDNGKKREFRRRLKFKRMPNWIQTDIRIVPKLGLGLDDPKIGEEARFRPDLDVLVHSYLPPMVASLSLISSSINKQIESGFRPKALCLGIGGGALLSFLRSQLGFEVFGVERDEEVLNIARIYFGFEDSEIRVFVGDAFGLIKNIAHQVGSPYLVSDKLKKYSSWNLAKGFDTKYEVVMVDLGSCNAELDISAPPLEFVKRDILLASRSILCDFGILVVNVIPPSRSAYDAMVNEFRGVFQELYEIEAEDKGSFVLIAKTLPVSSSVHSCNNTFLEKLRTVISGKHFDSIRKI